MSSIEIYTTRYCPYCIAAKSLLSRKGLQFTELDVSGSTIRIQRQTDVGYDVVEAQAPALVTVTAGVGEPRYASLKGIMGARTKEVKKLGLGDLGVTPGTPAEVVLEIVDAEQRQAGEVIEDDDTAIDRILALLVRVKAV